MEDHVSADAVFESGKALVDEIKSLGDMRKIGPGDIIFLSESQKMIGGAMITVQTANWLLQATGVEDQYAELRREAEDAIRNADHLFSEFRSMLHARLRSFPETHPDGIFKAG